MEPGVKDRDITYKLIIGQLYHDGHNKLALDLSNSIGMNPSPPPSDKLFRLVSAARLVEDEADEEEKIIDVQMSLNQVAASTDNLSIDGESRDYFPFLVLLPELKALVFSYLSIKDRLALAAVNNSLDTIERESKYHVEELVIGEKPSINDPSPHVISQYPSAQSIVFIEDKSYSSDCIRRIAHNASIGFLRINLIGSREFHREVYNLIKEINVEELNLYFKILLDGSTKLRYFDCLIEGEKCISFLHLIGITYRDGTLFSNRNIEVYKLEDEYGNVGGWNVFDGQLEMIFDCFENPEFHFIRHETQDSLEKAKNKKEMKRVDIGPE